MQLHEIITNWMTEELPKAKRTVYNNEVTFGIWERYFGHDSVVFSVIVGPDSMKITGVGCLVEYVDIQFDKVKFGKWGSNIEILMADPQFFDKMTYVMVMVAQIVTMGYYSPNGRHAPKKKTDAKNQRAAIC